MEDIIANPVVHANFDNLTDVKEFKFNFKKDELGNKRPSVELKLGVPSVEGLVDILQTGGKGLELLLEAVSDIIASTARAIINAKEDITATSFPYNEIAWAFIAAIEPKERRGSGITKETWEEFAKDYVAIMPAVTGKTIDQVGNAAKLLAGRFLAIRTNKPVIQLLKDQLALYTTSSPNAENFVECIEFLNTKATVFINSTEDLTTNL